MQTLLSNQKSDTGGPYVYYTLTVEPSSRTATSVNLTFNIEAYLKSNSWMSSGDVTAYFEFPNDQTRNFNIYDNEGRWDASNSPKTNHATWTISVGASETSLPLVFHITSTNGSGNLYDTEFDIEIPIGHIKPTISGYTMTETNQLLVNAGVSNNVFVENLSIKSFNINYQLYEGATLYRGGIGNAMKKMYSNTAMPVSMDLRQNQLYLNENNKVPIWTYIDDTYLNQHTRTAYTNAGFTEYGSIIYDVYDYIAYTPISLIETNTNVKRDGQVSGKVKLNVSGTYYNGSIGNVNQSSYKPVVKYKFWKTGTTEPSTYNYTVPSANVSISNGTFSVTNYAIGSTSTSATNYFNPDYSYKVKVKVDDNFSTYYSAEKSIPVGEATWTEYPEYVDFKNIKIGGTSIVESGSNTNGSYVKYVDGTMICWKTISKTINITNGWGNMYESTSAVALGNWPATFYAKPTTNVTKTAGQGSWLELVQNISTTSCGSTYVVSAVNRSNASVTLDIIGIGRWKA